MMTLKTLNHRERVISIVIVNYKSEHYLDKCLSSIYEKSSPEKHEIIIVNNDIDTDLEKIASKYPQVNIFNRKSNDGFGSACNYGVKNSKGDLIFFLNPDTQFLSDFIEEITDKFSRIGDLICAVGPRLITDSGETQEWCAGKDLTLGQRIKNKFWIVESREIWESKKDRVVDWVSGAALVMKRDIFQKVGGFDEQFFMYGEDLDLCSKARDLGYEILYWPEASILHSGGKSRENAWKQKIQFLRSSFYYIRKRLRNKSRD